MNAPPNYFFKIVTSLSRWRWLVLILVSPFLLFPTPGTVFALLIVPGLGILFWFAGEKPFARTPLNPVLLLLVLMLPVGLWVATDFTVTLPKLAGLILGLGVFDCFVHYGSSPRGWILCLVAFLSMGLGIALVGLLGTQWALKFDMLTPFTYRFEPRIVGLPGAEKGISPNEVAGALLWVIPTFLALSVFGVTELKRQTLARRWLAPINLLVWEAMLFVILVFLICQSRGAYLAIAITAIGLPFVLLWHRRRWFLTLVFATGILCASAVWRYENDSALRAALYDFKIGGSSLSVDALKGRDQIWARAMIGIERYPLTGIGLGNFRVRLNEFDPSHPIYVEHDIAHAHNEFLQATLDLGIPGLIAFIGIHVLALGMLVRVYNKPIQELPSGPNAGLFASRAAQKMLALGLGAGLGAHLLYGMTDVVALGAKPGILFWMLLGLVVGLDHQNILRQGGGEG